MSGTVPTPTEKNDWSIQMKSNKRIQNLVLIALFAALTLMGTMIKIPLPTGAFLHFGNAVVLLAVLLIGYWLYCGCRCLSRLLIFQAQANSDSSNHHYRNLCWHCQVYYVCNQSNRYVNDRWCSIKTRFLRGFSYNARNGDQYFFNNFDRQPGLFSTKTCNADNFS